MRYCNCCKNVNMWMLTVHNGSIHSIKNFQDYKKFRPRFCSNFSKTLWICLRQVKNWPEIQREKFPSNICKKKCGSYQRKTLTGWLWKLKFCSEANQTQSDPEANQTLEVKTTIFTVTPFMVQISPKYFHSREPQNHMTFNSSQLFETHPSTSLLKVPLAP